MNRQIPNIPEAGFYGIVYYIIFISKISSALKNRKNLTFREYSLVTIQIFGVKSSNDTRKAERFFKERNISYHFRDLTEKGVSKGELENIKLSVTADELIDKEGKHFRKRNLGFMVYNVESELLNDPLLFRTPIVRNGMKATVGYQPEIWKEWISNR